MIDEMGLASRFVIFDREDKTYHYGNGRWGPSGEDALEYVSRDSAATGLDDVDADEILRHRLLILRRMP
jgi:hypothetical protein